MPCSPAQVVRPAAKAVIQGWVCAFPSARPPRQVKQTSFKSKSTAAAASSKAARKGQERFHKSLAIPGMLTALPQRIKMLVSSRWSPCTTRDAGLLPRLPLRQKSLLPGGLHAARPAACPAIHSVFCVAVNTALRRLPSVKRSSAILSARLSAGRFSRLIRFQHAPGCRRSAGHNAMVSLSRAFSAALVVFSWMGRSGAGQQTGADLHTAGPNASATQTAPVSLMPPAAMTARGRHQRDLRHQRHCGHFPPWPPLSVPSAMTASMPAGSRCLSGAAATGYAVMPAAFPTLPCTFPDFLPRW